MKINTKPIVYDVIIVGGGLAGARAAVELMKKAPKAKIALISKLHPLRSHSTSAAGGINAAMGKKDNWKDHALDTIKGSDYLADQDAAEYLCKHAKENILELENWGALFSRTKKGDIAQRPFGGMKNPRTCFAGDTTGLTLLHSIWQQLFDKGLEVYDEWVATSLIVKNGKCYGLTAIDLRTGELRVFNTKATIFATGGYGRVFYNTTTAHSSTGDGLAIALRGGINLKDMEMVQFHPTSLYHSNILITEAARGEGGILLNSKRERFMERYAPNYKDLASRDVVSRSIFIELREGRGVGKEKDHVWLQLSHIPEEKLKLKLKETLELAAKFEAVDATKDPIPVVPAAHYTMGGIDLISFGGKTNVEGFYATGETSCISVHGANRLGGNSLLSTIVFGKVCGAEVAKDLSKLKKGKPPEDVVKKEISRIKKLLNKGKSKKYEKPVDVLTEIQKTMSKYFNVFRDGKDMEKGWKKLISLKPKVENIGAVDQGEVFNTNLIIAMEVFNIYNLALVIAKGAMERKESRGAHSRKDFPKRDDENYMKHTIAQLKNGEVELTYRDVQITGTYKLMERHY